jgi:FdhD protein
VKRAAEGSVSSKIDRGVVGLESWAEDETGLRVARHEEVVVEEPLEIRVAGEAVALTMRTPGDDRELALGFLHAEGVIDSLADVGSVYRCGRTDQPGYGNVIEVAPGPGVSLDVERLARARRTHLTTSACGVCGREGIDDLLARLPARERLPHVELSAALLRRVPALLARGQARFSRTGGLHGVCAVSADGEVLAAAEDVGRHNAVDKVVGALLLAGQLPRHTRTACLLAVSGRASFEIVQKAAMAGFVCIASVSAPSSLAVATAEASGLTLAAFVRDGRFTLYAHAERVAAAR